MGSSRRKRNVIEEGRENRPSTSRPVGEEESRGGVGGLVLVSKVVIVDNCDIKQILFLDLAGGFGSLDEFEVSPVDSD